MYGEMTDDSLFFLPLNVMNVKTFASCVTEYFTDLEGRGEQDPSLPWEFYSSSLFGETLLMLCIYRLSQPPLYFLLC